MYKIRFNLLPKCVNTTLMFNLCYINGNIFCAGTCQSNSDFFVPQVIREF